VLNLFKEQRELPDHKVVKVLKVFKVLKEWEFKVYKAQQVVEVVAEVAVQDWGQEPPLVPLLALSLMVLVPILILQVLKDMHYIKCKLQQLPG
jgi:hypothetical protein